MNRRQRQVVAEKISSTVRVLELLEFDYVVSGPKNPRRKGNRSPRVVSIDVGRARKLRVYNGTTGSTWANESNGKPIASVKSIEDLYCYLKTTYR